MACGGRAVAGWKQSIHGDAHAPMNPSTRTPAHGHQHTDTSTRLAHQHAAIAHSDYADGGSLAFRSGAVSANGSVTSLLASCVLAAVVSSGGSVRRTLAGGGGGANGSGAPRSGSRSDLRSLSRTAPPRVPARATTASRSG